MAPQNEMPEWKRRILDANKGAIDAGRAAMEGDLARIRERLEQIERDGCPDVTDEETYRDLIEAVRDATDRNLALAELEERVRGLGERAVALVRHLAAAT